jgi:hypothetical protein
LLFQAFANTLRLLVQKAGISGDQPITINIAKSIGSGNETVTYYFECDGLPCTSRTILLSHLSFDNVADFTDVSTVAYSGTVSIASTSEFNKPTLNPCPIEGAQVCALNHYGGNERVCRETDLNGTR